MKFNICTYIYTYKRAKRRIDMLTTTISDFRKDI